jgi:general secretion pathway protein B
MSYILDALRRAQAERERGQVPGLEARTMGAVPPPPPPRRATALWLGGALALAALVGAGLLIWRGGMAPLPPQAALQAPAASPQPAAPATPAAPAPPPAPASPMVVVSAPPAPLLASSASSPPSPPSLSPAVNAPGPAAVPPPPSAPVASLPVPVPALPMPVPVSGVRAALLAQLSPELRRELPALALGGAIWSDNAASRFVIVNGQVLREGDTAAPGVVLERIGPKAVFLRWRDWRIEVPI